MRWTRKYGYVLSAWMVMMTFSIGIGWAPSAVLASAYDWIEDGKSTQNEDTSENDAHLDSQNQEQGADNGSANETEADEQSEQDSTGLFKQDGNLFFLGIEIIFFLALILIFIYVFIRFLSSRQKKMGHHRLFQNIGGISVGQNKSLQIVKVGGKIYLLGVGDQITLIKEIEDEKEIEMIEKDVAEQESIMTKNIFTYVKKLWYRNHPDRDQQPFRSVFEQSLQKQQQQRDEITKKLITRESDAGNEGRFR